jgi:glycosyltransferase involved in cell wall biosynthesis
MKKKIIFLTDGSKNPNLPSRRLRVYEIIPYLEDIFDTECYPLPRTILQFLKLRQSIVSGDILFIQKELPSFTILLLLKLFNNNIVYDFDDAVYIRHDPVNFTFKKSFKLRRRFNQICRSAKLVIAGNEILQKNAITSGAIKTVVIPTSVETKKKLRSEKKYQIDKIITLGWVGQKINLPYLEALEGIFTQLNKEGFKFKLLVLSNQRPFFANFTNVFYEEWSVKKEVNFLNGIDIGLMPLIKNDYTEGKCAYKALQYMSYQKPVIVSDVGINAKWIKNGGISVKSDREMLSAIKKLIKNPLLRNELGRNGYKIIKQRFERNVIANKLKKALQVLL